jgi:hypothetical protein
MADTLPACDNGAATESLIMNIEKRNLKMFNIITIIVLGAVLLTAIGGILLQRQALPVMGSGTGMRAGNNLMQPESTQTSPTGRLVLNTGIILLVIGFVAIIMLLLVRRNLSRHNPS